MDNPWFARLGVTPPADTGEKEQEAAAPAQTDGPAGGKEQEAAAPAGAGTEKVEQSGAGNGPDGEEKPGGTVPEGAQTEPQSIEERRKQAQARRDREMQEKIQEAVAAERKRLESQMFGGGDLMNPYTGKPVTNLEEYEAYRTAAAQARVSADLKKGELTPEALRQAIAGMPEMQQLLEKAQAREARAAEAEEAAQKAETQAAVERDMAEIRKLNPAIKNLNDAAAMETGPEFVGFLQRGFSPAEAYKLANFSAIQSQTRAAGEQAARNAAAGIAHQQRTAAAGGGGDPATIPTSQMRMYRRLCKGMTDDQIRSHWQKLQKK